MATPMKHVHPASLAGVDQCQACGGSALDIFYTARNVPVHSCLMLPTREKAVAFPTGDIELAFCKDCGFIGNTKFDVATNRYSADYEETQGFSPRFRKFLDELCDTQIEEHGLKAGMSLLEIGCGKGEYLVTLCERSGARGIGFDPSYHPERTESPAASRIEFVRDLYGPKYAHVTADYISCRHTLEHIGPVHEFMTLIRRTIGDRKDVRVFFELPDMERVLAEGVFWDIYYEHCTYFTRGSLARLFRATGFDVTSLYKVYDGQYLVINAVPADGPTQARLPEEDDLAHTTALVEQFRDTVAKRIRELSEAARRWQNEGKTLAIWGSGSKCVAMLSALGTNAAPAAIVDVNPHKYGKFLAGTGYEIHNPDVLAQIKPDVVLIMNSIYTDEIRAELARRGLKPELVPL
jgi:hypothetical protein